MITGYHFSILISAFISFAILIPTSTQTPDDADSLLLWNPVTSPAMAFPSQQPQEDEQGHAQCLLLIGGYLSVAGPCHHSRI